jgi:hypothetical protein
MQHGIGAQAFTREGCASARVRGVRGVRVYACARVRLFVCAHTRACLLGEVVVDARAI